MNQAYRIIWNYALQTWVAAPETARARGKGAKKLIIGAVMALFGMAGSAAFAATPGSYAVGLLGGGVNPSECLTSAQSGVQAGSADCDGNGGFGAGFAAYNETGALGAYAMALDSDTLQFGASGKTMLSITSAGITSYGPISSFSTLNMNTNKITGLATGTVSSVSKDAINGAQLYATGNTTAAALGGGASVNSLGMVSAPAYALSGGTFNNVGDALVSLDKNGKYFHANSTLAGSSASGAETVAIGGNAQAMADNSVAIGSNSVADRTNTVSVGDVGGERQIVNVAAGTANTDAVNYGQLTAVANSIGNPVQYDDATKSSVKLGGATPVKVTNVANGTMDADAVNYGQLTAVANSIGNPVQYDDATKTSVKLGGATPVKVTNVANGTANADAVNYGQLTAVANSIGNPVQYDDATKTSVKLGGAAATAPVAMTNVKNGQVSATSTDAINGSQLYSVANSTANAFGGGSTVNTTTGAITAPTYKMAGNSTFNNVGDALTNLDGRVTTNTNDIATINNTLNNINEGGGIKYFHANSTLADSSAMGAETVAIGGNAQAKADNSVAIGSNSVADRADTVSVGAAGSERQITNVAAGTANTDAVNYGQLTAVANSIGNPVQYDDATKTSVKLGGPAATAPVAMTNVKNGQVSATSTDAINGSQLYSVANSTANAFGGGSTVNTTTGAITAPTYKMAGNSTFNNVGDALSNLDGRVTNNTNDIATINNSFNNINEGGGIKYFHANSTLADSSATGAETVAIGGNAQAKADNSVAIGSNSVADRADTVSVGAAGSERQIANVKAGTQDTDAVNVAQLNTSIQTGLATAVTYDDDTKTSVTLGGKGATTPVTLDNVKGGNIAADSLEAVNGSQLFNTASSTASALGGGSTVNTTTGAITAPTYTLAGNSTFNNVGDALTNLDGRVTNNTNDITSINTTLNNIANGGGVKYFHANSTLADSSTTGAETVAIGGNAQAKADNSVAIGSNSVADRPDTVSVGAAGSERQIANVKAGTQDTDAVNVAQLNTSIQTGLATAVTYDDDTKTSVTLGGKGATTPVTLDNVKGGNIAANSLEAVNGSQLFNTASSTASALGGGSSVDPTTGAITAPTYTFADNSKFNNVGDALTNLDGRVTNNTADITSINTTLNNIANGGGVTYFHANSSLPDSSATGAESVAIGGNAQASNKNSVAIGSNSVTDRDNSVSVGAAGAERQITNVAAGTKDTDAVNVSQLRNAGLIDGNGVSSTAITYDHNADGTTDYSNVTLGDGTGAGTSIHNVATGTAASDAVNVGQMQAAIDQVANVAASSANPMLAIDGNRDTEAAQATGVHAVAVGANANAGADNSVALGANSVADRANTVSVGSAGNERQITNVAAGTADTDAVNVHQLNLAAAQSQNYTDARISGVQKQINDVAGKAWGGIASAMAVAGLPQPTGPGKTMVAIAGSRFAGATGAAIGVSYTTPNDRWVIKFSGNTSSYGSVGVVLGSGYQW
jgi:trimeric autotransporter adhesin